MQSWQYLSSAFDESIAPLIHFICSTILTRGESLSFRIRSERGPGLFVESCGTRRSFQITSRASPSLEAESVSPSASSGWTKTFCSNPLPAGRTSSRNTETWITFRSDTVMLRSRSVRSSHRLCRQSWDIFSHIRVLIHIRMHPAYR